jgi:hypothetical protein
MFRFLRGKKYQFYLTTFVLCFIIIIIIVLFLFLHVFFILSQQFVESHSVDARQALRVLHEIVLANDDVIEDVRFAVWSQSVLQSLDPEASTVLDASVHLDDVRCFLPCVGECGLEGRVEVGLQIQHFKLRISHVPSPLFILGQPGARTVSIHCGRIGWTCPGRCRPFDGLVARLVLRSAAPSITNRALICVIKSSVCINTATDYVQIYVTNCGRHHANRVGLASPNRRSTAAWMSMILGLSMSASAGQHVSHDDAAIKSNLISKIQKYEIPSDPLPKKYNNNNKKQKMRGTTRMGHFCLDSSIYV